MRKKHDVGSLGRQTRPGARNGEALIEALERGSDAGGAADHTCKGTVKRTGHFMK